MERLDRVVVAVHQPDGKVFVSWRLLASDPAGTAFNLYREATPTVTVAFGGNAANRPREKAVVRLNPEPLAGPIWFLDAGARLERATKYFVRPVVNGVEEVSSAALSRRANRHARRLHAQRRLAGRPRRRRPLRDHPQAGAASAG
jgi:rhamnogalacturonan endolyase